MTLNVIFLMIIFIANYCDKFAAIYRRMTMVGVCCAQEAASGRKLSLRQPIKIRYATTLHSVIR